MTSTQLFQAWLRQQNPVVIPTVTIPVPVTKPAPLSDVVVGQYIQLLVIKIALVLAYVYAAGVYAGDLFNQLKDASYNAGYSFGKFVFTLNDDFLAYTKQPVANKIAEPVDYIVQQVYEFFTELKTN